MSEPEAETEAGHRALPTRDRLRRAALDLFERHGYDAVTPTQIAAAAGVSERTFFRHFPTKLESLLTVDDERWTFFADTLRAQPADLEPLEALLATIAEEERRFPPSADDRTMGRILLATPALADAIRTVESSIEALFAEWLAERSGRAATDFEVAIVAAALVSTRRVVMRNWLVADDRVSLAELAERALRTLDLRL
ncbi:MAG: TetR family transcriptional regulator [Actinomycetota bacterium]